MNRTTRAQLAKQEAVLTPPRPPKLVVISNMDRRDEFYATHDRFKNDAEMDAQEAAMRTSGEIQPSDDLMRIIRVIVDPKPQPEQEIRISALRPNVNRSAPEIAAALVIERDQPAAPAPRPFKTIRTTMTMDEFAPLGSGRGKIRVM